MTRLRVARHCINLDDMQHFYGHLLGFSVLGTFQNHLGYDGLFLGLDGAPWHLEFTRSSEPPQHQSDEDDLLVLFWDDQQKVDRILEKFKQEKIRPVRAKNPYWDDKASIYKDPEGYRVAVCYRP